ncbi:MAG: hypothetical protein ACLQVX_19535 [Limisphaerales bacterium]
MTDNAYQPAKIISAIEVLLAQLEASLVPYLTEGDGRVDQLKIMIERYKEQVARLKTVLIKAQAAERRKNKIAMAVRKGRSRP